MTMPIATLSILREMSWMTLCLLFLQCVLGVVMAHAAQKVALTAINRAKPCDLGAVLAGLPDVLRHMMPMRWVTPCPRLKGGKA